MKPVFVLILGFVCLNLGTWTVTTLNVFGLESSPYASPDSFLSFMTLPTTAFDIITWGFGIIGIIGGLLTHNPYVTIAALIVFAIGKLLPFGGWVMSAFPLYLSQLGVHAAITTPLNVLFAFVWFIAILEFISGRGFNSD